MENQDPPAFQRKHRRIVLRNSNKILDTGLTTGSSSEISDDESLKRCLSSIIEPSTQNKRLKTSNESLGRFKSGEVVVSVSPLQQQFEPVSLTTPEQQLTSTPIVESQKADVVQASSSTFHSLYDSESSQSEAELEHSVSEKKKLQGKRLSEYTKGLRAKGGIKKPIRKSIKAGLIFPVSRSVQKMKYLFPNDRIQGNSAIFLTAVVEYLAAELLSISGDIAIELKRKIITPNHILLAIQNDREFDTVCQDAHIFTGSILNSIEPVKISEKKNPGYSRAESMPDITVDIDTGNKKMVSSIAQTSPEHPRVKLSIRASKKAKRERGKRLAEFMKNKRFSEKAIKVDKNLSEVEAEEPTEENKKFETLTPTRSLLSDFFSGGFYQRSEETSENTVLECYQIVSRKEKPSNEHEN